jgi:3-methyladenine DNA glycosylase Mpg
MLTAVLCACSAGEAPQLKAVEPEQQQQTQQEREQQQQQQQQADGGDDGFIKFLGLKISKDDLLTITLALAISYGIRW